MPTSRRRRSIPKSRTTTSGASTSRPTRALDSRSTRLTANGRLVFGAVFVLLTLVLAACGSGSSEPAPTPTEPRSTGTDAPAVRDLYDLAQRFRGVSNVATQAVITPPLVGEQARFEVLVVSPDADVAPERKTITAALRAVSEYAYFYIDTNSEIDDSEVQDGVATFEDEVWPADTAAFGLPSEPGVDGDPHIVILHADLGNSLAGYVSDEDTYPKAVRPHSNQREMVYLNTTARPLGSSTYAHVLAHELQHLIHMRNDPVEEVWLNEGLSEYAGNLVSKGTSLFNSYLDEPDTQLNDWTDSGDPSPHYGAASLFVSYLLEQTGGDPRGLAALPSDSLASVREFLRSSGSSRSLKQFVSDWAVANALGQPQGPFGYRDLDLTEPAGIPIHGAGSFNGEVHQFAADYLDLRAGESPAPAVLTFDGDRTVFLVAGQNDVPGNTVWWGGRGDDIDSTLTRELDLTGVNSATLTFRTWFDIERWFDHGYVTVSRDGGKTWEVLAGSASTQEDPLEVGYGPSYSGSSGGDKASWVNERIDLTSYAGSRILLRFEYVTDGGFTRPGWLIDDIAVPETGFLDNAEADTGGWQREGFRRLSNPIEQKFSLRLITFGAEPQVQDIPLDGNNHAEVRLDGLGPEYNRAIVAIVGLTEGTTEPAIYRYTVQPAATPSP